MTQELSIHFDNTYAQLPDKFHTHLSPTAVAAPSPIKVNEALAIRLGLEPEALRSDIGTAMFAGNHLAEGAQPIATVYAGHQFGGYNPQLGDGRAVLLGEIIDPNGNRYDLQLKGSGPTPYSRGGDGRSPLGPVLREYVLCEAMHALGIPTTRALAAVSTGEQVRRETFLPGAVLARVASSHIRIGTFQFMAAQDDPALLETLMQYTLKRHFPDSAGDSNPALALLNNAILKQAQLIARWQLVGFIHGVMNTDNMLVCGETIDYGPCAFMDSFNPEAVFSSIDQGARYAYRNQPGIAQWNLACLAQSLLPLLADDKEQAVALAQEAIDAFSDLFLQAHQAGMNRKLGFGSSNPDDAAMIEELFALMASEKIDFTLFFRHLSDQAGPGISGQEMLSDLFELPTALQPWMQQWRDRCDADSLDASARQTIMYAANPVFIPRNHLVENALSRATQAQDFEPFNALLDVLAKPFEYRSEHRHYATPPRPEQRVQQTFCGT